MAPFLTLVLDVLLNCAIACAFPNTTSKISIRSKCSLFPEVLLEIRFMNFPKFKCSLLLKPFHDLKDTNFRNIVYQKINMVFVCFQEFNSKIRLFLDLLNLSLEKEINVFLDEFLSIFDYKYKMDF